ncbi:ERF family protein [Limnohabitans sp.]|uniref:ERF family protein n=1 Tax=Limnohabitans sp. TaxID=1907725 RepID=UPI0025B91491|nr:ERF family protein [Limnohabitans sp.]
MNETTNTANPALYAALAAAQGAFPAIEKNRSVKITMKTGGTYNFRYADLEEIIAKTRPALAANGLALIQPMTITGNDARLTCELLHKDGGRIVSEVSIPHPHSIQDPKQFGATVSYFRRYMVTSILGVAADDDLDEDGQEGQQTTGQAASQHAGQKPAVTQPQRRPAAPKPEQTGEPATQGEVAYINKKITTKGISVAEARQLAGLDAGDTLDGLTKDGFTALKDALA